MRILLFCVMALFITGCASPMQTLKKGNYERAYKQSLNQLKKGKSVKENEKVLSKSLTKILAKESREKEVLVKSDEVDDRVKALGINEDLQERIEKALPYVAHEFDEAYDHLREEADWLKQELANAYFYFAQEDLNKAILDGNKRLAREAYYGFNKARKYGYSGEEIDELQKKSFAYGQLVYTVEADVSFGISYEWEIDRQFDDIEDYGGAFRKIYFEQVNVKDVDCNIDISFSSIDIKFYEDSDRESFTRNVQTGTQTVTDADGNVSEVPVYEEVSASVIITTITKVAEWEVRVDIESVSRNCDLSDARFDERMKSEIEEVQFDGDERAIPSRYTRGSNDRLLSDDDMAEELMERLYQEVVRHYF